MSDSNADKKVVILYHGNCPDGFGGAYAAWKKFGDSAEYIALKHQQPITANVAGKDVYFIDFYDRAEYVASVLNSAARVVVLDHHEGVADLVRAVPEHVYDAERSGTTIAWKYFHPEEKVPYFLKLVQDADLFKKLSVEDRAIISYTYAQPWTFEGWDILSSRIENPTQRAEVIAQGRAYTEHFKLLVEQIARRAELVSFEGYEVFFVSAPRLFATELGVLLRTKERPFAMIARIEADGDVRVSLRGLPEVDVSAIARKFGGDGHPGSAAFSLRAGMPIPWKPILNHENTGD